MDSTYPARQRYGPSRDPRRAGRANRGAGHADRQHYPRTQQYQPQSEHQSSIILTCYLCHNTRHLQRSCPLLALWRSAIETICRVQITSQLKFLGSWLTQYPEGPQY
ncbi:hypothetical protein N7517_004267 [Penicillium concentricum]|uniref:CCHC-type domain-containing protein n=1 Tax=Penicillium concentricum TaxID=293559 RepID=A0A9W9S577_9EURO|nr:uncharacterized protein N7517_004267 [Penicillium concentricum]KAJ5372261.1 hypothetical protein N7517_004267 [Penicillium concentricum]